MRLLILKEQKTVWGGSSSVGCSVIQMAVASGYDVVAITGKRNHELCKSSGASSVFHHADSDVINTVTNALKDKELVGAYDCIGDPETALRPTSEILIRSRGTKKLMSVLTPLEQGIVEGIQAVRGTYTKGILCETYLVGVDKANRGF